MKNVIFALLIIPLSISQTQAQEIKPGEVKEIMIKVADWQMKHFEETYSEQIEDHHPLDWTNAAFYIGLEKLAAISGNDRYYQWLAKVGEAYDWKLGSVKYHADDHAVGQTYVQLYRKYGDRRMIEPTVQQLEYILYHPSQSLLNWNTPYHQDRWNWCDALFMSPPLWAKVYNITGDKRFLDFMMNEYKATTDFLFDKEASLYFRDERFKTVNEHGNKVFWSRGNGWVFAGLVNIMSELDLSGKEYAYFKKVYKKMARKLLEIQTPAGHWAMSLLESELYPTPETSGSSFFIYGLAWGINNGILERKEYEPAIIKGWNAMVSYVSDEGYLGYVQAIGAAPGEAWKDKTEVYGSGAFLSAGSEICKLFKSQKTDY